MFDANSAELISCKVVVLCVVLGLVGRVVVGIQLWHGCFPVRYTADFMPLITITIIISIIIIFMPWYLIPRDLDSGRSNCK